MQNIQNFFKGIDKLNEEKFQLDLLKLMFFYALENLHNEKEYSPFCGKNRD